MTLHARRVAYALAERERQRTDLDRCAVCRTAFSSPFRGGSACPGCRWHDQQAHARSEARPMKNTRPTDAQIRALRVLSAEGRVPPNRTLTALLRKGLAQWVDHKLYTTRAAHRWIIP